MHCALIFLKVFINYFYKKKFKLLYYDLTASPYLSFWNEQLSITVYIIDRRDTFLIFDQK